MLNRKILLLFSIITNHEAFVDDSISNNRNDRNNYVIIKDNPAAAPVEKHIIHNYDSNNYTRNNNPPSTVVVTKSDNNGFFIFGALVVLLIVIGLVANGQSKKTNSGEDFVEAVIKGHKTEILDYSNDGTYLKYKFYDVPSYYSLDTKTLSPENFKKILEKINNKYKSFTESKTRPANDILLKLYPDNFVSLLSNSYTKELINNLSTKLNLSFDFEDSNYKIDDMKKYFGPLLKQLNLTSVGHSNSTLIIFHYKNFNNILDIICEEYSIKKNYLRILEK